MMIMQSRSMSDVVHSRRPVCLPPEATVHEAARTMREHHIGAVLVTDAAGKLVGIFTGRDAVTRVLAEGRSTDTALSEVMTRQLAMLNDRRSAIEALRLMRDGGFRHVPIVQDERLVGIVSHGDFHGLEHARLDEETGYWEIL
jgi:CBS domain-containing protein